MARIVTVYKRSRQRFQLTDMADIRWLGLSQALAEHGHEVDLATFEPRHWLSQAPVSMGKGLQRVALPRVDWQDYDVVLTLFHHGFETLEKFGGASHPGLLVELDSVVGPVDLPGIYFYGPERQKLWDIQCRIRRRGSPLIVLTQAAADRWSAHGPADAPIIVIPAGIDRDLPPPKRDPFPRGRRPRCLFAGNIYGPDVQVQANRVLIDKLNDLGRRLHDKGGQVYLLGKGSRSGLDKSSVVDLGVVNFARSWNYLHWADVGLVLSAGERMDNNESSKIYHYLRAGLPVISESGFPNDSVVSDSGLGIVLPSGRLDLIATAVQDFETYESRREPCQRHTLENFTWARRAEPLLPVIDSICKGSGKLK